MQNDPPNESDLDFVGSAFDQFFKKPTEEPPKPKSRAKKERRPRQRDLFLTLIDGLETWFAPHGETFAALPTAGGVIHWPISSRPFKSWLAGRAYESLGIVPGAQALDDICRVIEARTTKAGKKQAPRLRVARIGEVMWVDLTDDLARAIEINKYGWQVIENLEICFLRPEHAEPLCEPEIGYAIEELRPFVNASDDDFVLIVAWMLGALRADGPYPILIIAGEQGSGKSALSFRLRSIVDPNVVRTQRPPKDERDLIVAAQAWHLLMFENVSHVPADLSDAYAALSTGGGFATRALHTDRGLNCFSGARPLALNGIELSGVRADLGDRAIIVHLKAIPEKERRPIAELDREWEIARPRILGALCTALSSALRYEASTQLDGYTRMADFERWVSAAEPGLGWEPGTFLRAYRDNRKNTSAAAFDADPVAGPVRDFLENSGLSYWEGTATDLLAQLEPFVTESRRQQRSWPKSGQALGGLIIRSAPLLREKGIIVEKRHSGDRRICLTKAESGI